MPWVDSTKIPDNSAVGEWWYNALDCAVTLDIHQRLPQAGPIYAFTRALQGPALDMMLRGVKVDLEERGDWIIRLQNEARHFQSILDKFIEAAFDAPLNPSFGKKTKGITDTRWINPNSPDQLRTLFYEALNLPKVWSFNKVSKKNVLSTDLKAMEKLKNYYIARPFINIIAHIKDLLKQASVLKTAISDDGRMRCSYNICGTETTRWSSSSNAFGEGTNMQNITQRLRKVFVADKGKIYVYLDLEQAESRAVGIECFTRFGDTAYLDACESGDLHTTVCRMAWVDLPWTGDLKLDKKIAEQPAYREHSYRDLAKRLGHGTNYYGKPPTMAKHTQMEVEPIAAFQRAYFAAFPAIPRWHTAVSQDLSLRQRIVNPLGYERIFFARPNDDSTLREAIASGPQSFIGQLLNAAMLYVWQELGDEAEFLMQVHDCFICQIPENRLDLVDKIKKMAALPMKFKSPEGVEREVIIPTETKIGWNWGDYNEKTNPDGLKKWAGSDDRKRQRVLD